MKLVTKVLAGIAGSVMMLSATASMAADVQVMVPPMAPPVVVVPPPPGFDWQGLYVGGVAVLEIYNEGGLGVWFAGGGAQVGFNLVRGNLVFGPVLRVGYFRGPNVFAGSVSGRAGVLLGNEDRILAYGAAGVLYVPAGPATLLTFGGGVEFAVGERLSIFTETRAYAAGGVGCCIVMGGANFHF